MKTKSVTLSIFGLGCGGGGARTIERALAQTTGVITTHVNPATEKAYIDYDPEQTNPEKLMRVIEAVGYRVCQTAR
jgi:Cu+-exporting ATPase